MEEDDVLKTGEEGDTPLPEEVAGDGVEPDPDVVSDEVEDHDEIENATEEVVMIEESNETGENPIHNQADLAEGEDNAIDGEDGDTDNGVAGKNDLSNSAEDAAVVEAKNDAVDETIEDSVDVIDGPVDAAEDDTNLVDDLPQVSNDANVRDITSTNKVESDEATTTEETAKQIAEQTTEQTAELETIELSNGTHSPTETANEEEDVEEIQSMDPNFFYDDSGESSALVSGGMAPSALEFTHCFGASLRRYNNAIIVSSDTVMCATGNFVVFHNLVTQSTTYLRSSSGVGVGCVSLHPSGEYIVVGDKGVDPVITVYSYPALKRYRVLRGGSQRGYTDLAFNTTGDKLASVSTFPDYLLTVWDWRNEGITLRTKAFSSDVWRVSFSAYNPGHLNTSGQGHIRFWKMASTFTGLKLQGQIGKFGRTELSDICGFVEFPDSKVLSGSEWGNLLLWEGGFIKCEIARKGKKKCHCGAINVVMILDDGDVATAGEDGFIRIWDFEALDAADRPHDSPYFETQPIFERRVGHGAKIQSMSIWTGETGEEGNNSIFLVQDMDGFYWKVDVAQSPTTRAPKRVAHFTSGAVNGVSCSPSHTHLAVSGSEDGRVRILDIVRKKTLLSWSTAEIPGLQCTSVLWPHQRACESGRVVFAGFNDGIIRVFAITTTATEYNMNAQHGTGGATDDANSQFLALVHITKPFTGSVSHIVITSNGDMLVAACKETNQIFFLSLENSETCTLVPVGFTTLTKTINSIRVVRDGECEGTTNSMGGVGYVLIGCDDATIIEMDIPPTFFRDSRSTFDITDCVHFRSYTFNSIMHVLEPPPEETDNGIDEADSKNSNEDEDDGEDDGDSDGDNDNSNSKEKMKTTTKNNKNKKKEVPPFLPSTSPILDVMYNTATGGGDTLIVCVGGLDAGYVYECSWDMPKPMMAYKQTKPLYQFHGSARPSPHQLSVLPESTSNDGNSVCVLAMSDGALVVSSFPNISSSTWQCGLHDGTHGGIVAVAVSHDGAYVVTCGGDGNVFVLENNLSKSKGGRNGDSDAIAKHPSVFLEEVTYSIVEDMIDPNAYCIEDELQRAERDRQLRSAEEKKQDMRHEIMVLRREFESLVAENDALKPSLRVPAEAFVLNPALREDMENKRIAAVHKVEKEMQWTVEKHRVAHNKLRSHFFGDLMDQRIVVKCIERPENVTSFRQSQNKSTQPSITRSFLVPIRLKTLASKARDRVARRKEREMDANRIRKLHAHHVHFTGNRSSSNSHLSSSSLTSRMVHKAMQETVDLSEAKAPHVASSDEDTTEKAEPKSLDSYATHLPLHDSEGQVDVVDRKESARKRVLSGTTTRTRLEAIAAKMEERKKIRTELKKRMQEMFASKPDTTRFSDEDEKMLQFMKKNMGDYKLKTSSDYVVPVEDRVNTTKKRVQILTLRANIHDAKSIFNSHVYELRQQKLETIEKVRACVDILSVLFCQLGLPLASLPSIPVVDEEEFPEKRDEYTQESLLQFKEDYKRMLEEERSAKAQAQSGGFGGFGGGGKKGGNVPFNAKRQPEQSSKAGVARTRPSLKSGQRRSSFRKGSIMNNISKRSRKSVFHLPIDEEEHLLVDEGNAEEMKRIQIKSDIETLKTQVETIIKEFDNNLMRLVRTKRDTEVRIKFAEYLHVLYFQELVHLKVFDIKEKDLERVRNLKADELQRCKATNQRSSSQYDSLEERINQAKAEEKKISSESVDIIKDNHPFVKFLSKMFRRKIKRKKRRGDGSGEGESGDHGGEDDEDESSDEDSSDDEASDSDSDDEEFDDSVCPQGCNEEMYHSIFSLRERRLDAEDELVDLKQKLESVRKERDSSAKKLKTISIALDRAEEDISEFQLEKQQKLNELHVAVPLRLSQIHYTVDNTLPTDISDVIVFEEENMRLLHDNIIALEAEKSTRLEEYKHIRVSQARLTKEKNAKESVVKEYRHRFEEMQKLKFGKIVDLDTVANTHVNTQAEDLKEQEGEVQLELDEEVNSMSATIKRLKQENIALMRDNTSLMADLSDLLDDKNELEVQLNTGAKLMRKKSATLSQTVRGHDETMQLKEMAQAQKQQIDSLRMELYKLSRKGGHVAPPAKQSTVPTLPPI
eukprot:m.126721 g.126721  ORF g.126721 m.126721 type:complete len:2101 (-) comp9436_c0_seq1:2135-8437(-)